MHIERNMKYMNYKEKKQHMIEWTNFRIEAMKEAVLMYGEINEVNLKNIQNYMKKETKKWKEKLR